MEMTIRIYTERNNYSDTRTIFLNEGALDDMVSAYLREEYLKDGETISSITYEEIKL